MNQEHHSKIREHILDDIKSGHIAMTPRAYFTLRLVALLALVVAVVITTIFIFNFIFFSIRINGDDALLAFGPRGFETFLAFFPWGYLILDIVLIFALQWLVRYFRMGYRIPVLYLIAGLLVFSVAFGFALDSTRINENLMENHEYLPRPFGDFYGGARHRPERGSGICECTILSISGDTLTVRDTRVASSTLTVALPQSDDHATTTGLQIGDTIFIAGDEEDGVIHAFGVRKEEAHDEDDYGTPPSPHE